MHLLKHRLCLVKHRQTTLLPPVRCLTGSGARGRHSADFDERKRPNRTARGKRHRSDATIIFTCGLFDFASMQVLQASVVMQRLSYPTETVLSNNITRNIIFLSCKDSPRKPLRRRPSTPHSSSVHSFAFRLQYVHRSDTTVKLYCSFRGTLHYSRPKVEIGSFDFYARNILITITVP